MQNNDHPTKLTKAINRLILNNPFFATIALQRNIIIDESCDTAWTDGDCIAFSPKFIEENDLDVIVFTLAHEILHITNLHHTRMKNRDPKMWNEAADYAINWMLKESGFKLWERCLISNEFADKCAEDIYRILESRPKNNNSGNNNQSGGSGQKSFGEVRQAKNKDTNAEEEKVKVETKQAERAAKQCGKLPSFIERMYKNIPPNIDWREALAQFVSVISNNDYSFNKVNTRYSQTGFIFPGLYSKEIGNVILACDTSGSISSNEVSIMVSELLSLIENLSEGSNNIELPVIYCDSVIQNVEILTNGDNPKPKGGGGTDFKPPFEYISKNFDCPACMVYITDGYCNSFPENPGYPVLWALFVNNPSFKPPFGEVVYISNGGK